MTDRIPSFAITLANGSVQSVSRRRTAALGTITRVLEMLGTSGYETASLWPLPEGEDVFSAPGDSTLFVQAAGTAAAMTLEWGRYDDAGNRLLSTLGIAPPATSEPSLLLRYGRGGKLVFAEELFTAADAVEVFTEFLDKGVVPSALTLRDVDLKSPGT